MTDPGSVVRRCPFEGCTWDIEIEKLHPEDEMARQDAESQTERHIASEHRGEARVRVVLERDVSVHPKQNLQDIVDSHHDRIAADPPAGYEVAYAFGELLEESDDPSQVNGGS